MYPRLLFLSCSQRKRLQPDLLPAIERYDGPFFRVLRRYQQGWSTTNLGGKKLPDVYVLSAEYGLIPADRLIPDYERRMTPSRAEELRPSVLEALQNLLRSNLSYQELFLCMGREYRRALEGWEVLQPPGMAVGQAEGSMGGKQAQLHDWLHGVPPSAPAQARNGTVRIYGIEVDLTPQQVLEVARQALHTDGKGAADYRMWYVLVDDRRVSLKWLVSQLTGLPVNKFHSDSARQILVRLGVQIERVTVRASNMLDEEKR